MKLDASVRKSIFTYPSMYRVKNNPGLSRFLVLEHMFCTIGGGYKWHPSGYLAELSSYKEYDKERFRKLPKDYFQKEIYQFEITKDKLEDVKDALKDHYWYKNKNKWQRTYEVKIETSADHAGSLAKQFSYDGFYHCSEKSDRWLDGREVDISPYPMCKYSAIVELGNGETNSPHIKNFYVQQDYIDGAVEISKEILNYYNNPERYKNHSYYPGNGNGFAKMEYWDSFAVEQMGYCNRLLEKYS